MLPEIRGSSNKAWVFLRHMGFQVRDCRKVLVTKGRERLALMYFDMNVICIFTWFE